MKRCSDLKNLTKIKSIFKMTLWSQIWCFEVFARENPFDLRVARWGKSGLLGKGDVLVEINLDEQAMFEKVDQVVLKKKKKKRRLRPFGSVTQTRVRLRRPRVLGDLCWNYSLVYFTFFVVFRDFADIFEAQIWDIMTLGDHWNIKKTNNEFSYFSYFSRFFSDFLRF